jgi:DNA-binding transcriptional regulator YiaG
MTSEQFCEALLQVGLKQIEAARYLAVDVRTVRAWMRGESRVPRYAELLLGFLLTEALARQDLHHSFDSRQ